MGRRISVRHVTHRRADGQLGTADVVGDLVGLDAQTAVLDTRAGLTEVALDRVVAARRALPSTADELALEAVAARGLRAVETEQLGGWLLRADHGFTRRANSVLPLRAPGLPLPEALGRAQQWYAQRGLPLVIACPTEARRLLDAELGELGWEPATEAHVMTARLDQLAAASDPRVGLLDAPDAAWLALYRGGEGVSDTGRALLARHDTVTFARLADGGRTAAVGRAVVDDGWLGVSAVEVAADARRQGFATAVMAALWQWGLDHGAVRTYLQVEVDNHAAVAMYRQHGYAVHHDYRYRLAPPAGFVPAAPW